MFHREPVTDDFRRFATYASRVRALKTQGGNTQLFNTHDIPFDVWAKLMHYGPQPLLPNLRSLYHSEIHRYNCCEPRVAGRGPVYRSEPLFGPRLKKAFIEFGDWPSDEWRPTEVVESLSYRSPLVESLKIEHSTVSFRHTIHDSAMPARLSGPAVAGFLHLVKFESYWAYVSPAALLALGSLRKLQELVVHVDSTEYDWEALPHGRQYGLFSALKELTLYRAPSEWCVAFMDVVSSSSLWRLHIKDYDAGHHTLPPLLLEAFFTSLARHPSSHTIRELDFTTGGWDGMLPPIYGSRHIAPLLSLSALQKLTIFGHCLVVVDDALLEAVTRAWPNIQSLHFCWPNFGMITGPADPRPGQLGFPQATLAGVFLLARYCPYLTSLDLGIDLRDIPYLDEHRPPIRLWSTHPPPLESLRLPGLTLREDDEPALAMLLSVVFPQLKSFTTDWREAGSSIRRVKLQRTVQDPM
ncbi:uncharacterized protein TRAVEDRAFT_17258 [Trametes versicolor FP-101664 SS1]|uniref:uncharacterized protein n=1 Tax=Trametes versicolor (strain FP-101664) TaxID=717944 RepID=UPI000462319B|nr:uncharacterized protein TRAVEDRAFT_17258 [Trametes versicolor FP-101664 SS1]EIW62641.1 hypothetical protein TRAVEDRAFT_17258 [Trametes versicolor FP-101664 SS1]